MLAMQEAMLVTLEIRDYMEIKLPLNANGHNLDANISPMFFGDKVSIDMLHLLRHGQPAPFAEPFKLGKSAYGEPCYYCGQTPEFETDGVTVTVTDACPNPDGITIEFDLAVPSGVMVISDNLQPAFPLGIAGRLDIGYAFNDAKYALLMAAAGCAFGSVGNNCPQIYRVSGDNYTIATNGHTTVEGTLDWKVKNEPEGEPLLQIVTDQWTYCIADKADFEARGIDPDDCGVLKYLTVRPGVYHFRHHFYEAGFTDEGKPGEPVIFAHFDWVRPIDS